MHVPNWFVLSMKVTKLLIGRIVSMIKKIYSIIYFLNSAQNGFLIYEYLLLCITIVGIGTGTD